MNSKFLSKKDEYVEIKNKIPTEVKMKEKIKIQPIIAYMIALMLIGGGFFLCCQTEGEEGNNHQVTGTFTVDGKAIPLKYVYTWHDSSFSDDTQKDLMFLFSDKPVPEDADIPFDLGDLGRKGKIHAIEVRYSKSEQSIVGGAIHHEAFGNMMMAFGGQYLIVCEFSILNEQSAEGKIHTNKLQESFDDHTWEVEAEFKTILKKEKNQ